MKDVLRMVASVRARIDVAGSRELWRFLIDGPGVPDGMRPPGAPSVRWSRRARAILHEWCDGVERAAGSVRTARFWAILPDGRAVKLALRPGQRLAWSGRGRDGLGAMWAEWSHRGGHVRRESGYSARDDWDRWSEVQTTCTAHLSALAAVPVDRTGFEHTSHLADVPALPAWDAESEVYS